MATEKTLRKRENTRARLIEAGARVFTDKGFAGAKIDDVVTTGATAAAAARALKRAGAARVDLLAFARATPGAETALPLALDPDA